MVVLGKDSKHTDILVYGTLREGHYNHKNYMFGMKPIKRMYMTGLALYDMGPYPYIISEPKGVTVFEHYRVPDDLLRMLNRMELGAGYIPAVHREKNGDTYVMWIMTTKQSSKDRHIPHGDYTEYIKRRKVVRPEVPNEVIIL